MKNNYRKILALVLLITALQFVMFILITDFSFYAVNKYFREMRSDISWEVSMYYFRRLFFILCFACNMIFALAKKRSYAAAETVVFVLFILIYWANVFDYYPYRVSLISGVSIGLYLCGTYFIHKYEYPKGYKEK